jgi:hypothetical protein
VSSLCTSYVQKDDTIAQADPSMQAFAESG